MTLDEAKRKVQEVRDRADDDESAHGLEDQLYFDFVKFIADEMLPPYSEIAREILKTEQIEFSRWCA